MAGFTPYDLLIPSQRWMVVIESLSAKPPLSSGPGRGPLKAKTRIRIPLGAPLTPNSPSPASFSFPVIAMRRICHFATRLPLLSVANFLSG